MNISNSLENLIRNEGVIQLNSSLKIPSLTNCGYKMKDLIELINMNEIFICKAKGGQTIIVSKEYYQIIRNDKALCGVNEDERNLLNILNDSSGLSLPLLISTLRLDKNRLSKHLDRLLKHRLITVIAVDKVLNDNWITYIYTTAEKWEKIALFKDSNVEKGMSKQNINNEISNRIKSIIL